MTISSPTHSALDTPPADLETLRQQISDAYPRLSKRLQQLARFALDHPNDMALETIVVIAERAGVPPSALIRFAKAFGYSGFSDMQRIFQMPLAERSPSYSERIRRFKTQQGEPAAAALADMLRQFCAVNIVSLEHLRTAVAEEHLQRAVALLMRARLAHVIGQRRSFPVAGYLAYALSHAGIPTQLLSGVGGMLHEQVRTIGAADVLVAVSFHPYAPETLEVTEAAARTGAACVIITDSPLSPLARHATLCFEIHDAELHGFRSLTASLCLAQTLAVGVAMEMAKAGER
ncbi:MAG TPA: MurR/RpiR family transcriptional regulator [Candidatus Competibacteraceae bacterium]|nr:MurR/RpiR family transcriptional regulator [Candidatus Competibacteraceae bacterium]